MKLSLLFLLLAISSLSGCQSDPWSFQYARSKQNSSIAGRYEPTARTQTFLKERYGNVKHSRVELRSDNSFVIRNISGDWAPFPTGSDFTTVSGRWSLVKHQDWWAVQLDANSVRESGGKLTKYGFITQALLIGQERPYTLHFGIGDPDSGDALQYELP